MIDEEQKSTDKLDRIREGLGGDTLGSIDPSLVVDTEANTEEYERREIEIGAALVKGELNLVRIEEEYRDLGTDEIEKKMKIKNRAFARYRKEQKLRKQSGNHRSLKDYEAEESAKADEMGTKYMADPQGETQIMSTSQTPTEQYTPKSKLGLYIGLGLAGLALAAGLGYCSTAKGNTLESKLYISSETSKNANRETYTN